MDVVPNYAAGEEAVGAFFSCEGAKGKRPVDEDGTPSRGLKKNKEKHKARQLQQEDFDGNLVAPWSGRSLEALQMGVSSIRC